MFLNLNEDIKRYKREGSIKENLYLLFEQGIWAICVYRFGRWVREVRIPIISLILKMVAFFLFKFIEIITSVSLPFSAVIGKGLYVGHFGPIILHSDVVIGENFSVGPGVVIGTRGSGNTGVPRIGDNVYIGVGAKILGGIDIGDNVKVGANAVVLHDVPEGEVVVGIPAKSINPKKNKGDIC
ncbi:serine O-acetyltransferase [Candidatus Omnitrophota bacterium]